MRKLIQGVGINDAGYATEAQLELLRKAREILECPEDMERWYD